MTIKFTDYLVVFNKFNPWSVFVKVLQNVCFITALGILVLSLNGCVVTAVGAGIGAVKYGNSKTKDEYNKYVLGMQQVNLDREKAHLKPEKIMTYDEYKKS